MSRTMSWASAAVKAAGQEPLNSATICSLVKRRLADASLPGRLSPHNFRVSVITDLLTRGVPLENVQYLVGQADPRTTGLYLSRRKTRYRSR